MQRIRIPRFIGKKTLNKKTILPVIAIMDTTKSNLNNMFGSAKYYIDLNQMKKNGD